MLTVLVRLLEALAVLEGNLSARLAVSPVIDRRTSWTGHQVYPAPEGGAHMW